MYFQSCLVKIIFGCGKQKLTIKKFVFHVNRGNPWPTGRTKIIRNPDYYFVSLLSPNSVFPCGPRQLLWLQLSYLFQSAVRIIDQKDTLSPYPQQSKTLPRSVTYYFSLFPTGQTFITWPQLTVKEAGNCNHFLSLHMPS